MDRMGPISPVGPFPFCKSNPNPPLPPGEGRGEENVESPRMPYITPPTGTIGTSLMLIISLATDSCPLVSRAFRT